MPVLIDGNNLLHAMAKAELRVGRSGLCRLLSALSQRRTGPLAGEGVAVVFDGRAPEGPLERPVEAEGVAVEFSGPASADELIISDIAADSAPRRLTVVSTDREIRQAARRRRCRSVTSEEFVGAIVRELDRPPGKPSPEPPEKRHGLTPDQTRAWLKELGLDDDATESWRMKP